MPASSSTLRTTTIWEHYTLLWWKVVIYYFGKNVKLIIVMENFLSEIWQKNLACLYCSGFITGLHALVRRTKNVNTMHKQWVHKKSQRRVKTYHINQHSKVLTKTVIQKLPTKIINFTFLPKQLKLFMLFPMFNSTHLSF